MIIVVFEPRFISIGNHFGAILHRKFKEFYIKEILLREQEAIRQQANLIEDTTAQCVKMYYPQFIMKGIVLREQHIMKPFVIEGVVFQWAARDSLLS